MIWTNYREAETWVVNMVYKCLGSIAELFVVYWSIFGLSFVLVPVSKQYRWALLYLLLSLIAEIDLKKIDRGIDQSVPDMSGELFGSRNDLWHKDSRTSDSHDNVSITFSGSRFFAK